MPTPCKRLCSPERTALVQPASHAISGVCNMLVDFVAFSNKKGVHMMATAGLHRCPGLLRCLMHWTRIVLLVPEEKFKLGPFDFFKPDVLNWLDPQEETSWGKKLDSGSKVKKTKPGTVVSANDTCCACIYIYIYMHISIHIYRHYSFIKYIIQTIVPKSCIPETLGLFFFRK